MRALVLPLLLVVSGCDEAQKNKPAPDVGPATSSSPAAPAPTPTPAPSPSASASAAKPSEDEAVPPLVDAEGKPLPQTEEKPSLRSKSYEKRVNLLWRAIQVDDPKVAYPAFFPELAYAQVKAIPNPAADYKARLIANFDRDVHWAHKQLGDGAGNAQLVGLELLEDKAKWMPPGGEGNKVGYYRALGSKLRYLDGGGAPHALDVTSLISWRGEWYVVHLHGFK
ncbi:MAG: hypothetical protein ACXWUG_10500 [Polyangiales bacterium]